MTNTEVNTYLAEYCQHPVMEFTGSWNLFQIPFQKFLKEVGEGFARMDIQDKVKYAFASNDADSACIALIRAIEELKNKEK